MLFTTNPRVFLRKLCNLASILSRITAENQRRRSFIVVSTQHRRERGHDAWYYLQTMFLATQNATTYMLQYAI